MLLGLPWTTWLLAAVAILPPLGLAIAFNAVHGKRRPTSEHSDPGLRP